MLKIRKYKETDKSDWDTFVSNSNNGTMFHLRKFLSYHPKSRFTDHSLIVKKTKTFCSFCTAEKEVNNEKYLTSHPGVSFDRL